MEITTLNSLDIHVTNYTTRRNRKIIAKRGLQNLVQTVLLFLGNSLSPRSVTYLVA